MAQSTATQNKSGETKQSPSGNLQRTSPGARNLSRWDPFDAFDFGPFSLMRRMQDDIDRVFGNFGVGRLGSTRGSDAAGWVPAIDVFHRGNEFVVRADVPGLSRDDLTVEIGDDSLTIRGERKYDHHEEREGVVRSERGYGTFSRLVPLPEGVIADSAKANFKNGVLEIVMQAPPQEARRGRRIEIASAEQSEQGEQRGHQKQ